MRANDGSRTGGEVLVDQLVAHGVRHVFCVPGESYLAALDAFYDRPITLTVCRAEGGATMAADPDWQIYVKKLSESGLLMEQQTSLMVPAKFAPPMKK